MRSTANKFGWLKLWSRFIEDRLDLFASPTVRMFGLSTSAFTTLGLFGLTLAAFVTMALSARSLSIWIMGLLVVNAVATFFLLAFAIKIGTGVEQHVHYQHELAIFATTSLLLSLLGQPVLAYLDLVAIGKGVFLAVGRVGCFKVGCCHGKPVSWGVRYRREHAEVGFPDSWVGVRLFPSQLLESFWCVCVSLFCVFLIVKGYPAGSSFAWYVVAYGGGRFLMEFLRGDQDRPYLLTYSEAQWTSIALISVLVGAEIAGVLPFSWAQVFVLSVLFLVAGAVSVKRRFHTQTKIHVTTFISVGAPLRGRPSSRSIRLISVPTVRTVPTLSTQGHLRRDAPTETVT